MDKIKSMIGIRYEQQENDAATVTDNNETERGILAEALDTSTLSWSTRMQGFGACFVLGVAISLLAVICFALGFSLSTFGILYSLGNIVALSATLFLMGPFNQIKRMFNESRWIASSVMLICLFMTLFSAFYLGKKGLTVLFCVLQFLAMTWYCLSYIPFARDAVKKAINGIIG